MNKKETEKRMDKINPAEVCKETRKAASEAFLAAIKQVLETVFSEKQLKDVWLSELRKRDSLLPSGWYSPPPDGIGILIGNEREPERLNYDSLRPEENWPQDNLVFDPETGLVYVYASPVDRNTGVIGDWAMTLYAGKNPQLITHLQRIYNVNHRIVEKIRAGVKISDAYHQACAVFESVGLTNNITSVTDPAGINVGHSIPGTLKPFSAEELAVIQSEDWERACKMISKRRVFFNGKENSVFQPGDCFTLEPRLTDPQEPRLPMVSFHTIIRITEDRSELLENFEEVFQATNMNYMLS